MATTLPAQMGSVGLWAYQIGQAIPPMSKTPTHILEYGMMLLSILCG